MKKLLFLAFMILSGLCFAGNPTEQDCINCQNKLMNTVKPNITAAKQLKSAIKTKGYLEDCRGKKFSCYTMVMCNKFYLAKDRLDIEEMFEMIPTMAEYNKVDDFFFMVECSPKGYNQNIGIKAPMIHLIVDNVIKRHDYLETIFEMYDYNGEASKFKQILNLKSTENETFLDYLYYVRKQDRISIGDSTRKSYEKIFKYACDKGAELNKYKAELVCGKTLIEQIDKK